MTARWLIAALSIVVLLSACGPLYRTTYDYTPPRARIGQLCSTQCAANRDSCRGTAKDHAQKQYSQCEIEAHKAYEACLNASAVPGQGHFCTLSQCDSQADYRNCDVDYRGCYSACGGKVIPHKHCVFDCPKTGAAGDS